jgi:hypothetical protein
MFYLRHCEFYLKPNLRAARAWEGVQARMDCPCWPERWDFPCVMGR